MAIELLPYEGALVPAVKDFNARMLAGGVGIEYLIPETFTINPASPVSSDWTIAVENDVVRGGYILQWRDFQIGGERHRAGDYQTPISEGVINKKYALVGAVMIKHALRRTPRIYTVGMGGLERPLPKMLKAMGWSLTTVPFRFHVARPGNFLHEIQHLRTSGTRRLGLDLLAASGLGWAGIRALEQWKSQGPRQPIQSGVQSGAEPFETFGDWADELWKRHANDYLFAGARDAATLNALYTGRQFERWKLVRDGRAVGWVVVLIKKLQQNKYFGDMKSGVIVDAWSPLPDARWAIATGAEALRRGGADVIFANTLHPVWLEALRRERFLAGPTNFGFAVSPKIAESLNPFEEKAKTSTYLMRGDGDGLANFLA